MTEAPRNANLPPGFDEADPYEGKDLAEYPGWWRENIELFREHELRPYRPPRFEDGKFTPEVIADLEAKLDVEIRLRARDPKVNDDWGVWVDDERVADVGRRRDGDGYTVYELTTDRFERLVRDATGE
jgi:hypothetical protein